MKIAIISPGYLPLPAVNGGAVEGLIDFLIDYNEGYKKDSLFVYSVYDEKAERISKNYKYTKFIYIKRNLVINYLLNRKLIPVRFYYKFYCEKMLFKLKKNDIDLILIQNELIHAKKIKKSLPQIPMILHLHNDYINKESEENGIIDLDSIVTVSKFLEGRVREVNPDTAINTVYNGVDLKLFVNDLNISIQKSIREEYGIDSEQIVLIYAGRLSEEKGVLELITAFNAVENTNIVLMIVGSSGFKGSYTTPYVTKLKKKAKESKNKIIFTGYVDHVSLSKLYHIADIGCVPSLCKEAFGLTIVEQMATGLPIIASNQGAIPEIIDESCGIIVAYDQNFINQLSNSIDYLVNNPEKRKKLSFNAFKKAQKYAKEVYAKNMFDLIHERYNNRGNINENSKK